LYHALPSVLFAGLLSGIRQWGYVNNISNNDGRITLPVAFSKVGFSMAIASSYYNPSMSVDDLDYTYFHYRSSGTTTPNFRWIAIGI